MERMERVAISSASSACEFCSHLRGQGAGWDYCPHCQYTYTSVTDVRSDYADQTVGFFLDRERAARVEESLIPLTDALTQEQERLDFLAKYAAWK